MKGVEVRVLFESKEDPILIKLIELNWMHPKISEEYIEYNKTVFISIFIE